MWEGLRAAQKRGSFLYTLDVLLLWFSVERCWCSEPAGTSLVPDTRMWIGRSQK